MWQNGINYATVAVDAFILFFSPSIHLSVVLGKSFPFHFKMHDITPHLYDNVMICDKYLYFSLG